MLFFSLSQENAAAMMVTPPIPSINTSAFAATGVTMKGKSFVLYLLVYINALWYLNNPTADFTVTTLPHGINLVLNKGGNTP